MCGHPDGTTLAIFISLLAIHVLYLLWLVYQFRIMLLDPSLRSIRVFLQYMSILLFILRKSLLT